MSNNTKMDNQAKTNPEWIEKILEIENERAKPSQHQDEEDTDTK